MALDGGFIYCLAEELRQTLKDARVDKIHQPSREELIVALRSKSGTFKLYMSARVQSPRVHIVQETPENPATPPMFCMLLRKKLTGGKLMAIRQDGLERVLYFDFDCINELGDPVRLTLSCEMTGRHSNIVLIGDGKVVDAIKRVDFAMSETRPILPNVAYEPPAPFADRVSPLEQDGAAVVRRMREGSGELSKVLLNVTQGFSPLVCREIASLTLRRAVKSCEEMTEDEWERLAFYIDRVRANLLTGERRVPYLMRSSDGMPTDFSYMLLTQFGLSAVGAECDSFSELLERFYSDRDKTERLRARAHDTLKLLVNATSRIERKLGRQREELAASSAREEKRLCADMLMAQLYAVPTGASSVTLVNYYDENGGTITISLDPALSASQNAQRYYKDYRKAQTAERVLAEQIDMGEKELAYLDSVLDALSRAASLAEIAEVRRELAASGYIRETDPKRRKPPASVGPMRFVSSDGFAIAVGRNNIQNDQLTLKTARGRDVWFHVKDMPGSHTVVFTNGAEPPEQTLLEAAMLAAFYSKAANSAQVPVDYTLVKYVHKPSGAKPGMVIYEHQKTVYVTPDPSLPAKLMQS